MIVDLYLIFQDIDDSYRLSWSVYVKKRGVFNVGFKEMYLFTPEFPDFHHYFSGAGINKSVFYLNDTDSPEQCYGVSFRSEFVFTVILTM